MSKEILKVGDIQVRIINKPYADAFNKLIWVGVKLFKRYSDIHLQVVRTLDKHLERIEAGEDVDYVLLILEEELDFMERAKIGHAQGLYP
jgi:hypothetical protein